jgi:predicted flap endonuclease-1-like 5' DNA nuclease
MSISISRLMGMSPELAVRFRELGIGDTDQLLAAARTPADRNELADKVGTSTDVIRELANRADLCRIRGIAGIFGDLLEHAGVDTVVELATRNPENLYATVVQVNEEMALAGRHPYAKEVESWVAQAKELPRALEY